MKRDEACVPQPRDIFADLSQWERNTFLAKCREQRFGTESVRQRLAYLLLQLGDYYGIAREGEITIKHHFSHEELARMVGATRSWVSLTLGALRKEGVLKCRGRQLIIVDKEGLKDIVRSAR